MKGRGDEKKKRRGRNTGNPRGRHQRKRELGLKEKTGRESPGKGGGRQHEQDLSAQGGLLSKTSSLLQARTGWERRRENPEPQPSPALRQRWAATGLEEKKRWENFF